MIIEESFIWTQISFAVETPNWLIKLSISLKCTNELIRWNITMISPEYTISSFGFLMKTMHKEKKSKLHDVYILNYCFKLQNVRSKFFLRLQTNPSVCLFVYPSNRQSIDQSFHPFIHPSISTVHVLYISTGMWFWKIPQRCRTIQVYTSDSKLKVDTTAML